MERDQAIAALVRIKAMTSADLPEPRTIMMVGRHNMDADLEPLREFPSLEYVEFRNVNVTGPGLVYVCELPNLHTLTLDTIPLTDDGLAHVESLKGLVSLNLTCCGQVGDEGIEHVRSLTRLRQLDVSNTRITDVGLGSLEGLVELEELDLHGTLITDAGLVHLGQMTKLRKLDLGYTCVTDAGLRHLKGLTGLRELSLEDIESSQESVDGLQRCLGRMFVVYGSAKAPFRVAPAREVSQ
jgi:internalin A